MRRIFAALCASAAMSLSGCCLMSTNAATGDPYIPGVRDWRTREWTCVLCLAAGAHYLARAHQDRDRAWSGELERPDP